MTGKSLQIAVVSDLHAYVPPATPAPSFIATDASPEDKSQNPIPALKQLIKQQELSADFLFCCGDMGDKANPTATTYAWSQVHDLADSLGSARVIATSGNHDLDSRFQHNDYDAKGVLQGLHPPFPLGDNSQNDYYWSRNFVIVEDTLARIVVLNSSAYHGAAKEGAPPEYLHGRVSERTLHQLSDRLDSAPSTGPNILLCHHHPLRHDRVPTDDYSEMQGGDQLLELLSSSADGRWLIVHGHKHFPRVTYAPGGGNAPVVFAAGSLASMNLLHGANLSNQFYLLEIEKDPTKVDLDIAGTFRAWDWSFGHGWIPARSPGSLPERGGFGYAPTAASVKGTITAALGTANFATWEELLAHDPRLSFVTPEDLDQLGRNLSKNHGIQIERDATGLVREVSKK